MLGYTVDYHPVRKCNEPSNTHINNKTVIVFTDIVLLLCLVYNNREKKNDLASVRMAGAPTDDLLKY